MTQARAFGAFTGRDYGSFAGRGETPGGPHPVDELTQARSFGAFSGKRYGSFAGRSSGGGSAHPVARLTQLRAHGAFSGRRYGAFAGRGAAEVEDAPGGGVRRRAAGGGYQPRPDHRRTDDAAIERPRGETDTEQAFDAAEEKFNREHIAALVERLQGAAGGGSIQLPPAIVLPSGRTVSIATASKDDMALLMLALFMAMDDD